MSVATITEIRQLALASEGGSRGTLAAAASRYLSATKDSNIDFTTKLLADPALRGYNAQFASFAGAQEGKGPFKTPVRTSSICEMMKMLLGSPTASVEQASFVVTLNVNDTIDWIGAVTTYAASVAAGTYLAGQTQADAGTLCALLYTAMHTQDATISGVSYTRSTGLFTITRTSGIFTLLLASGTNHAKSIGVLLGFAATLAALVDLTSADTYTTTIQQTPPFKYTFVQSQIAQLPSYSFFINRGFTDASGNTVKGYNLGQVAKMKFSGKDDAPVEMEASLMAQLEATSAISWTPNYFESPVLMFNGTTVKVAGAASAVPNVPEWSIDLDPGLKAYRPLSQQQYPFDFLAPGPFKASGDMQVYFMTEAERNKFINDTLTSLEFLCTGALTGGGTVKDTLDISLPNVEYDAYPFGDEGSYLGAKVKYKAVGAFSAGSFVPLVTAYVISRTPPGF
jgi:hypothetical protein